MDTLNTLFPNWHWLNLLLLPGVLLGFTVHELAHALVAHYLGDQNQVKQGHITPNMFKHISWFGIILFSLFGLGWPKPLRLDPTHFRDRYLDSFLVAIAGPAANLALSMLIFLLTLTIVGFLTLTNQLSAEQFTTILFFSRSNALASLELETALQNASLWVVILTNRIWIANFILATVSLIPLPPFDGFTAGLSLIGLVREKRIK